MTSVRRAECASSDASGSVPSFRAAALEEGRRDSPASRVRVFTDVGRRGDASVRHRQRAWSGSSRFVRLPKSRCKCYTNKYLA